MDWVGPVSAQEVVGISMKRSARSADDLGQGRAARRLHGALMLGCAVGLMGLAACAPRPQDIQTGSIATRQPAEHSMVDMPAGGPAILGVVERHYANSTTQEVILENRSHVSGQNTLSITMFGPVKLTTGVENIQTNDPLALMNAGQEMRNVLSGVQMHVSNLYAQNRYGSFGFATGRSSMGDVCLYAWQRIRAPDHDSTMISNQGTVSIRLRLCQSNVSETELLNVMTGFSINSYFLSPSWNPYGAAPPLPDELGRPGVAVLPPATSFAGPVATAPRVVRRKVAVEQPVAVQPSIDTVLVPAPGTAIPSATVAVPAGAALAQPTTGTPTIQNFEGYPAVPPP